MFDFKGICPTVMSSLTEPIISRDNKDNRYPHLRAESECTFLLVNCAAKFIQRVGNGLCSVANITKALRSEAVSFAFPT